MSHIQRTRAREIGKAARIQASEHPLEAVHEPATRQEHCLLLMRRRTYQEILLLVRDKTVLNLSCNADYGAMPFACEAHWTVRLDVSGGAIAYAQRRDNRGSIQLQHFKGRLLPLAHSTFEAAVSSQVIEHVPDVPGSLAEIKRYLIPGGIAAVTTPSSSVCVDPDVGLWSSFHLRDCAAAEFRSALGSHCTETAEREMFAGPALYQVEFMRCQHARAIARWREGKESPIQSVSGPSYRGEYLDTALDLLAVCTSVPLTHSRRVSR